MLPSLLDISMERTIDTYMYLMLEGFIDLTTNCRAIVVRNRFLMRNISHTKHFSDSRKKRDAAREKRDLPVYREKRDER